MHYFFIQKTDIQLELFCSLVLFNRHYGRIEKFPKFPDIRISNSNVSCLIWNAKFAKFYSQQKSQYSILVLFIGWKEPIKKICEQ